MKNFKDLKTEIKESDGSLVIPSFSQVSHGRYKVDKKDEETMQQIRAAIARELDKSYMSPWSAIINLRTKLNLIGIDFDLPERTSISKVGSSFSASLKKANATFGKDGDTPYDEYIKDDSDLGLTLTINIGEDENSLYKLTSTVK